MTYTYKSTVNQKKLIDSSETFLAIEREVKTPFGVGLLLCVKFISVTFAPRLDSGFSNKSHRNFCDRPQQLSVQTSASYKEAAVNILL